MSDPLRSKKVLIVDDNPLLAHHLCDVVQDWGAVAIGPAMDLSSGLELMRTQSVDCALLDIELGGSDVYPLAEQLSERDVPFAFLTAKGPAVDLPAKFRNRNCIQKPETGLRIIEVVVSILTP